MSPAATLPDRARAFAEYLEDIQPPSMFRSMLPRMVKMAPVIWAMGFLLVLAGFGVGIYQADQMGKALDPRSGPPPTTDFFAEATTIGPWLGPLQLLGLGMMLFGISVTVLGIAVVLRNMGEEAAGVFLRAADEEAAAPGSGAGTGRSTGEPSPDRGTSG